VSDIGWLALAVALVLVPARSGAQARLTALSRSARVAADEPAGPLRRAPLDVVPWVFVVATVAASTVALLSGPALGVAAVAVALVVAALVAAGQSQRRADRRGRGALAVLRLLVAELEAGARPCDALAAAASASPDLAPGLGAAADASAAGGDAGGVLIDVGADDLRPLGHAWRVASEAGAPLADVLGRMATDRAAEQAQTHAVATALAGPRSTAALLAVLPIVGIGLGWAMGAQPLTVLFESSTGRLVCCAGCVLDAAGVLWTLALIRRAQRP